MLDLTLAPTAPRHIRDFQLDALEDRPIVVGRHCFGCTAGAGSSCGGATLEQAPQLMSQPLWPAPESAGTRHPPAF
jgi:hypothetical protein